MKTAGILIIIAVGVAITLVNLYITRTTIADIVREYEGRLEARKNQNRDLLKKLADLSERTAALEGELATYKTRVNAPQVEFLDVPRGRR